MNLLRLHDPLLSVLFENDEIVAVDKLYGIDTHTNDSKAGNADLIQHGLIELFEKQLKLPLHIVHRLDRTTTGAIIFAKSLEAAKKYQLYFRNREAKKTYLFVTDRRSTKGELSSNKIIVHKGSQLDARTDFTRLARSAKYELWQANPHTGRNHQIRIHAADVGLPLLGDPKYGGTPFPFICLHDRRIAFPNGVSIEAEIPSYFAELELLEDRMLAQALFEVDRRLRLFSAHLPGDQCFRLVHTRRGSEDLGFTLDQLGRVLLLTWHREDWTSATEKTLARLARQLQTKQPGKTILVRLANSKAKAACKGLSQFGLGPTGVSAELAALDGGWVALEQQQKYRLRIDSGQAVGPFLDLRLQRAWAREAAKDKSVLNVFAQTGGFGVAVALGGASEVVLVESNKNSLDWERENFRLNGLDPDAAKLLCRDSLSYLEQCVRKNLKFDLLLCTPPNFVRREKGVFKIEARLDLLLELCLRCLNPGGTLLFSTTSDSLFVDDLRKAILQARDAAGLKNVEIGSLQASLDFELPGERTTLKSFLIRA